ncbi:ADAMTS-like protein 3 [Paramacrobiotus metropolitanus]|uniref:ADAMTS-like protein 3 n=1 Tax=Paramacrobiotus metropolitanus TaxID=2943436 RepID=UPI00244565C2|nr:ADAMTS-like protein 3 [Paramacrobiotus metropolitanus]
MFPYIVAKCRAFNQFSFFVAFHTAIAAGAPENKRHRSYFAKSALQIRDIPLAEFDVNSSQIATDYVSNVVTRPLDGGWSEWSPWSACQATCGSGIRIRNRWCDNPAPQNGGKDCVGDFARTEQCITKVHCPINGGWSPWAPWACTVSCGGGTATRTRQCNNPKPFYGGVCIGSASEQAKQPCNAFTCPPVRKVSEETNKLLEDIKKDFFVPTNLVREGTRVAKVQCASKQLLDNLIWELKLSVRHAIQWLRNGQPWKEDKSRVEKSKFTLGFNRVAASDTGFYSCELDLLGGGKKILKAFSLIVLSNKTNLEVDVNKPFDLECNSLALGALYPNARISWYFNDTLYRSFNDTPAVLTNTLKFAYATTNMTGDWECLTYEIFVKPEVEKEEKSLFQKVKDKIMGTKEQTDKPIHPKILNPLMKLVPTPAPVPKVIPGKIWITNKIRLRVNPPPELSDLVRTPHFMGLCTGVGLLAFVTIIALIKGKANNMLDNAQEKVHKFAEIKRSSRIRSNEIAEDMIQFDDETEDMPKAEVTAPSLI